MRHLFLLLAAGAAGVIGLRLVLAWLGYDTFTRTDTRIDGILYGVMLAILYHHVPETFQRLQEQRWIWVLIVAIALMYFRLVLHGFWVGPVSWICADAMGIALVMLLYRHREGKRRPAVYRLVARIGLYSYGIYLWHVSVLAPCARLGHHLPPRLELVWAAAASPILGIIIGIFFTKLVEFPALKLRDRLYPRRVDSAVGKPAEAYRKDLSVQET